MLADERADVLVLDPEDPLLGAGVAGVTMASYGVFAGIAAYMAFHALSSPPRDGGADASAAITCPGCTFQNDPTNQACAVCDTKLPQERGESNANSSTAHDRLKTSGKSK